MAAPLDALLQHPLLWRASGIASANADALATGFPTLDKALPGGGWPRQGLIEILDANGLDAAVSSHELYLFAPLFAKLFPIENSNGAIALNKSSTNLFSSKTQIDIKNTPQVHNALAWIAPPLEPYAPALAACGIDIKQVLIVRTHQILWAMEQLLCSAACRVVIAWINEAPFKSMRRLQLAAQQSKSLGILVRPLRYGTQPSPAVLRLSTQYVEHSLKVTLIKSRGGQASSVSLPDVSMS